VPSRPSLVEGILAALSAAAEPTPAPQMQSHEVGDALPRGRVPQVCKVVMAQLRLHPPATVHELGRAAAALWRAARYREERYAALNLTGSRMARGQLELPPLYREMIVTGAWWDYIDEVSHRIRQLLANHPASVTPVVLAWSRDPDVWLRRSSTICQLRRGEETDLELLTAVIAHNVADPYFYVRKAIGWALRDYAWTDPEWVLAFVDRHRQVLSPLSAREATKNICCTGTSKQVADVGD
jgi:3-methyladenine DNA glycosylase AlkD